MCKCKSGFHIECIILANEGEDVWLCEYVHGNGGVEAYPPNSECYESILQQLYQAFTGTHFEDQENTHDKKNRGENHLDAQ